MKILFCSRVFPDEYGFQGGIFILNQAAALQRAGHQVAVLLLDFRSPRRKRRWGFSRYCLEGVSVYRWAFPCGPVFPLMKAVAPALTLRLYKQIEADFGQPDLLYAHFGDAACDARVLKERFGLPYAVLEHDSGILLGQYTGRELQARKDAYDQADAVLAVSAALGKKVQALTRNPISVVPNMLPAYMFEPDLSPQFSTFHSFAFISVGNLVPGKAFDRTLRAFATLYPRYPAARLLIAGDGPEGQTLRALAEELGIERHVEFLGRVDNRRLARILRQCDCFVLPSRFETFGVAYLEAMASGLPVIATRCGGPEEFVNAQNGILVPVDDHEALVQAMQTMLENRDRFQASAIRDFARTCASEQMVCQKLTSIFHSVLEKQP